MSTGAAIEKAKLMPPSMAVKGERRAEVSAKIVDKDELLITFLREIDEYSFADLVYYLKYYSTEYNRLRYMINSPGGDPIQANAICDLSQTIGMEVSVDVYGEAYSAAGIIAMSAPKERRRIAPNAIFHLHYATGYGPGVDKLLEKINANVVKLYAMETGDSEEDMKALFDEGEVYFTAEESVQAGFFGSVINNQNKINMSFLQRLMSLGSTPAPEARQEAAPVVENKNPEVKQEATDTALDEALLNVLESQKNAIEGLTARMAQMEQDIKAARLSVAGTVSSTVPVQNAIPTANPGGGEEEKIVQMDATGFFAKRKEQLEKRIAGGK